MGKSRGGLSTKIHAAVDALGNPVRLLLRPGQSSPGAEDGEAWQSAKALFCADEHILFKL